VNASSASRLWPARLFAGRRRIKKSVAVAAASIVAAGAVAGTAYAYFEEPYGGYAICGSNCYVQSGHTHTWYENYTVNNNGGYQACQLVVLSGGYNVVEHGGITCRVFGNRTNSWARGYNQSGASSVLSGYPRA
jgi:hypothetical protein